MPSADGARASPIWPRAPVSRDDGALSTVPAVREGAGGQTMPPRPRIGVNGVAHVTLPGCACVPPRPPRHPQTHAYVPHLPYSPPPPSRRPCLVVASTWNDSSTLLSSGYVWLAFSHVFSLHLPELSVHPFCILHLLSAFFMSQALTAFPSCFLSTM